LSVSALAAVSAGSRRVLVPAVLPPVGRAAAGRLAQLAGASMGTSWSVKLVLPGRLGEAAVRDAVEAALARVICEMSTWEPGSAISRYNHAAPGTRHDLPGGFAAVLACALKVAAMSEGAFDPTIGPATDLWGFGPAGPSPLPGAAEIENRRLVIGWSRLRLDGQRLLQPGGVALDLSGIAKGFAVDLVAEELVRLGVPSFLVEIGGELRGQGVKPDLSPWWVALERPPGGEALPETVVALHGLAIATSGDYRRFRSDDAGVCAHTLDPRTAAPVRNGIAAVTVIGRTCMEADALATALTVLGVEDGLELARRHDIAALLVERGQTGWREHASPAFIRMAG
jgi:thiamine biosynthesis lipoprotein